MSSPTERGLSALPEAKVATTKALTKPLRPSTFLLRNAGKTVPLVSVIVLAVLLITGIVSLLNSIPLSIRTIYSYSKEGLGVTPRGDTSLTPKIVQEIKDNSPVPIERTMICRASSAMVRSIVGKWPFIVIGLTDADMRYYLRRQGASSISGRLPAPGAAEAIVSEPVARNLGLKLGSSLLGPNNTDNYSPHEVKVVGIANTDRWLMLNPIEYQRANHFPPVDFAMVFAKNATDQDTLDRWAEKRFKGRHAQVFAYHMLDKETNQGFSTLYRILDVVIATLVLVITLMMGMLINIYQSQRLVEFGLLQAIGHTRKWLIGRVISESALFVVSGWLLGVLIASGFLVLVKQALMDPNAWALNTFDTRAMLYTLPAPLSIFGVAVLTVFWRFRRFDPVGVVERRLI